jgi:hypothetical protein
MVRTGDTADTFDPGTSSGAVSCTRPYKFFVLRYFGSKYLKTKYLRKIHAANALKREYLPKTPGGEGASRAGTDP